MIEDEPANSAAPDRLTFSLVTTLGDQTAFLDHALRAPALRRARLVREALFIALAPLGLVIGGAVAWLSDGDRAPLPAVLHDLATTDRPLAVRTIMAAFAIMAVCLVLSRVGQRAQRRRILRQILLARPDVDSADPELSQRTEATFGPEGIDSRTEAGTSLVRWSAIQRLDDTEAYLFFVSGPYGGFIVPKRGLQAGQAERLRAIAAASLPKPRAER